MVESTGTAEAAQRCDPTELGGACRQWTITKAFRYMAKLIWLHRLIDHESIHHFVWLSCRKATWCQSTWVGLG